MNEKVRVKPLIDLTLTEFQFLSFSDDGTLFSCESTLGDDITADDLPKCVESTKTCYCKTDDCNALKPKIKCTVTSGDDKKEQECQHGIVNCKNTTTSKQNIQTVVYFLTNKNVSDRVHQK